MRLPMEQSRRMIEEHGCYFTDACDKCGKLLAEVRFTVKGQSGEWCSRECRDGVAHEWGKCRGCGASLNGKRKGMVRSTAAMPAGSGSILAAKLSRKRPYKTKNLRRQKAALSRTLLPPPFSMANPDSGGFVGAGG